MGLAVCIVFEILASAWICWMILHEGRMIRWERNAWRRLRRWAARKGRQIRRELAARYWTRRGYVIVAYRPAIRRRPAVWTVEKRVDGICTTRK